MNKPVRDHCLRYGGRSPEQSTDISQAVPDWVQNSVFEGELTKAEYLKVRSRLNELIDEKRIVFLSIT